MKNMVRILIITLLIGITGLIAVAQNEFKPNIDFKGSRIAIGYLDSQNDGSYPDGSFQMPDAKLRFNWNTTPDVTVVTRMSLKNATFDSLDYFYLDYKNFFSQLAPKLKDSPFNPTLRIGRIKVDIGEETFADNPVEGVVASNSAGIVAGYDEGLQLFQNLHKDNLGVPVKWSLSFFNGNSGTGADNEGAKAMNFKLGVNPISELYVSGSYYKTGELGVADAEVTYAGLKARPTNATQWTRTIQEIDLRYDFQPGKENRLNPGAPAFSDSKAFVRTAYGKFADNGKDTVKPIVQVVDREGKYYFVEGCYNATEKLYLAARQSNIEFDKNTVFASLNSVNANKYSRMSIGAGYRMSSNTHLKIEQATNTEKIPTGAVKAENNQYSLLITVKF